LILGKKKKTLACNVYANTEGKKKEGHGGKTGLEGERAGKKKKKIMSGARGESHNPGKNRMY